MRRGRLSLIVLSFVLAGALAFLVGFLHSVIVCADTTSPDSSQGAAGVEPGRRVAVPPLEMFHETYELVRNHYRLAQTKEFKEESLLYAGLDGMMRSVGDPYTRFLEPTAYRQMMEQNSGQFQGIGAYLKEAPFGKYIMLAPIPKGPAEAAGLKPSDLLLKIEKTDAIGMDTEQAKNLIRGPSGSKIRLTLGRRKDTTKPPGDKNPMKELMITVERAVIKPDEIEVSVGPPAGHEKDADIGYIRLHQFNEVTESQLDDALTFVSKRNIKGLIIDVRDNPGGLLDVAIGVVSRFVANGPVVHIQESGGNRRAHNVEKRKYRGLDKPIVVLVNRFSASASEILAGALKDTGTATLVGETTFGKGLVQTIIPLDGDGSGGALKITTARYFTPNNIDINHKGIKPDVEVKLEGAATGDPFASAAAEDKDAQIDQAIKVLRQQIAEGRTRVATKPK